MIHCLNPLEHSIARVRSYSVMAAEKYNLVLMQNMATSQNKKKAKRPTSWSAGMTCLTGVQAMNFERGFSVQNAILVQLLKRNNFSLKSLHEKLLVSYEAKHPDFEKQEFAKESCIKFQEIFLGKNSF
ncbi:hypothetical protein ACJMK2_022431 [Sinanodonta woodiana]|uniref:Uncharacterized protein n=1 Tax=Sinanodonta woodiana TaxID=1069815 RepID=A0ABD3TJ24_SINWO